MNLTFAILGLDKNNSQIGLAIATYSLAVGSTCPLLVSDKYAITSQASTNPIIGKEIAKKILVKDPKLAMNETLNKDKFSDYRQVAILSNQGDKYIHTGTKTKDFKGSIISNNCIAIGNFLYDEKVLVNMAKSFEENHNKSLGIRLINSLKSGKKAGGQKGTNGEYLPERSSCLMIASKNEIFPIDIRVDFSNNSIEQLSYAYEEYNKLHEYYLSRSENPANLPAQDEWIKNINL
ncbi:MAG: hypothetical protein CL748_00360 [Chloroflexi bacterium]|nr:hypothetical protein [Chloroflexota bacterium]